MVQLHTVQKMSFRGDSTNGKFAGIKYYYYYYYMYLIKKK